MRTPIPICAGTKRRGGESNEMGTELTKKFGDDLTKDIHGLLQVYNARVTAAKQADDAQKAAEEIVFGFYRSGFAKCNSFA